LTAAVAVACVGCLVSEPPEYEEPSLTPPFLDMISATPLPGRIIVRHRNQNELLIKFDVPFRSEDAGEPIWFALHRNYTFGTSTPVVASQKLPAGTFDETDRSIRFDWNINSNLEAGCHQLTLLVSHDSTWVLAESRPDLIRGIGDSAMATWWLNFDPPEGGANSLENCPTLSEVQQ
jgi:hypothetical protein